MGRQMSSSSMRPAVLCCRRRSREFTAFRSRRPPTSPVPRRSRQSADQSRQHPVVAEDGTSRRLSAGIVKLERFPATTSMSCVQFDTAGARLHAARGGECRRLPANLLEIRAGMQLAFGLLYLGVALVVLAAAIWLGIAVANRLVSPIRPADRRRGQGRRRRSRRRRFRSDHGRRPRHAQSQTFNKMTAQLRGQRAELVAASDQIDSRRRFTEAVLSGVTAGVIGIDGEGRVTIVNRMALRMLLGLDERSASELGDIVPELAPVVAAALRDDRQRASRPDQLTRAGRERTINVRVTTEGRATRRMATSSPSTTSPTSSTAQRTRRLGRRRAPHRPRDQEPADADPALGRAAPAEIRQADHRRSRDLRPVHRHDHPPGRRHRPDGRRVLVLRADAEAGLRAAGPAQDRSARRSS